MNQQANMMETPIRQPCQRSSQTDVRREPPLLDRAELVIYGGCALVALLSVVVGLLSNARASERAEVMTLANTIFAGLGLVAVAASIIFQNQATLEVELGREYREITSALPSRVWVKDGPDPSRDDSDAHSPSAPRVPNQDLDEASVRLAYRYFDLCNTQALLRQQRRISRKTWLAWKEGIQENLQLPWFADRYEELHMARGADTSHFFYLDKHVPASIRRRIPQADRARER